MRFVEYNTIRKDPRGRIRIALCYPNYYRGAVSCLGFQLLYFLLNSYDEVLCERSVLEVSGRTLESGSRLKDFDVVAFTLQFELDYPNVLRMLRDGGIPVRKEDRGDNDPIVIAGGPCAVNPIPMEPFVDLFFVGEFEPVVDRFVDVLLECRRREEKLEKLSEIEGFWRRGARTRKAVCWDLDKAFHPRAQFFPDVPENSPLYPAFGKAILLEVNRGCGRMCRFCLEGHIYLPPRFRSLEPLEDLIEGSKRATGLKTLSLIGSAVPEHPSIIEICQLALERGLRIILPSFRVDFERSDELLEIVSKSGTKSVTIAPEACERLRSVLGKDISDEEIISFAQNAREAGISSLKLYVIFGIPGERREDLLELRRLIDRLAEIMGGRRRIKISANPLVPKPHTPFQWLGMARDFRSRARELESIMRGYEIDVEWREAHIQAALSVGDERASRIVEILAMGRRISMRDLPDYVFRGRDLDALLPWRSIDVGLSDRYLSRSFEKAMQVAEVA